METKVTKKAVRKVATEMIPAEAGPFAAVVVEAKPKKAVTPKKKTVAAKAKPVRKAAVKVMVDPFAELAEDVAQPEAQKAVKKKAAARRTTSRKMATKTVTPEILVEAPKVEYSEAFKVLAQPELPKLERDNRARLHIQSPTRAYFYWSVRENPYRMLRGMFGSDLGSYTLVLKLKNLRRDTEEIHQVEAEGNWWFDVVPGGEYQAEIGFYAPNRPYFRVLYSNTVTTPRRTPSPRAATELDWALPANKFAEVLDVAGFSRDAFDVAMAGDDIATAETATHEAFSRFVGSSSYDVDAVDAEDIRYAMIALAAGVDLYEIASSISPSLFAVLQANAEKLVPAKAMSALGEHFDIEEADIVEEQLGPAIFGASLVNFPRTIKTRGISQKHSPRYNPMSSHSLQ